MRPTNAVVLAGRGGWDAVSRLRAGGYAVTVLGCAPDAQGRARRLGAHFVPVDLASLVDVRRAGADLAAAGPLELLVNAAAASWPDRWETVDGVEATFAINHLAPALMTETLIPALIAAPTACIVDVAGGPLTTALDVPAPGFDVAVEPCGPYHTARAVARTALAHTAYLAHLAERLRTTPVEVTVVDVDHEGSETARYSLSRDTTPPNVQAASDPLVVGPVLDLTEACWGSALGMSVCAHDWAEDRARAAC